MTRMTAIVMLAALTVLGVAGCVTSGGGGVPERTITLAEADARVVQHVRAVAAVLPGARVEDRSGPRTVSCGGIVGGPEGLVYAARYYWVRDIPPERNAEVFEVALGFWLANGYTLGTDARDQGYLSVGAPDGTGVFIQEGGDSARTLSTGARSPCVWPDGIPPTR